MSNLIIRLKNAFRTGGIKEIIRKAYFHYLYKFNNYRTRKKVEKADYEYGLYQGEERKEKIIVSLTSYPARFPFISLCLKSLILQSVKPDKILVYLGSDTKESDITKEMREFEKYGVEYKIDGTKNLRSYKKFYYSMQEYPNDIIITADDDLIYPKNWIESMYKTYQKFPQAISSRRVHKMIFTSAGVEKYNHWLAQYRKYKTPKFDILATSGSGMLFPAHSMPAEAFNDKVFMEICYGADDIWLKCMATLNNTPIVWVKNNEVDLGTTEKVQTNSLTADNVFNGKNDEYLNNVMNHYSIKIESFRK